MNYANQATVAVPVDQSLAQKVIDSLDQCIGSAMDANERKRKIVDRVFGCSPTTGGIADKSPPTAPGLEGEIGVRMDRLRALMSESHDIIDRLTRIA